MKVDEVPGELDSDPLVVPFRQNSPNVGPIPSPYYMNKTTTSPHSCTSHRRAAAHRRAGGKRALRLLIFRFLADFEEIYLYFVPRGAQLGLFLQFWGPKLGPRAFLFFFRKNFKKMEKKQEIPFKVGQI